MFIASLITALSGKSLKLSGLNFFMALWFSLGSL